MLMIRIMDRKVVSRRFCQTARDWTVKVGALGFEPRSAGFHQAGSDPAGINRSLLQLVITGQQTRWQSFLITGAREYTVLAHTPTGQR